MFFSSTTQNSLAIFFFFNDTATTEIYTLSLHDALPIFPAPPRCRRTERTSRRRAGRTCARSPLHQNRGCPCRRESRDRKSTRLNSSHGYISYAVFCLKKKNHLHAASTHGRHSADILTRR